MRTAVGSRRTTTVRPTVNETRPLIGQASIFGQDRVDQYFRTRHTLRAPYEAVAAEIGAASCREVGLVMSADDWEYPLWLLLQGSRTITLRHVAVTNPSAAKYDRDATTRWPCATIVWESAEVGETTARALEATYSRRRVIGPLTIHLDRLSSHSR